MIERMVNQKNKSKWICFWLAMIAVLILCGVILFAAFIYKFDPRSPISELFQTDASVIWDAINVFATTGVGIATVAVSVKLQKIEKEQHLLQTEPHILIDFLDIRPAEWERTVDKAVNKTIKGGATTLTTEITSKAIIHLISLL